MIYFVSLNKQLFKSEIYSIISKEETLEMILSWKVVQFDTETTGRDPHICNLLCYQFGNRDLNIQVVVDNITVPITYFKEVFEHKLIIGHNLKFDDQFLFKYNIIPKKQYDTMIVEQFLYLGYNKAFFHFSLKDVALRYLNINIDKTTRGEIQWRGLDDQVIFYAAGDVMYLEDIRDKQLIDVQERNGNLGIQVENAFVVVIAYLEWCGIKLDVEKWKLKMLNNEAQKAEKLEILNKWVIDLYNKEGSINTYKEVDLLIKECNHGYIENYEIPKGAIAIGQPFKVEGNWGIVDWYQKFKIKSEWSNWVIYDTQGDLFSGYDLSPKCNLNWGSSKKLIPFFQYIGFNTTTEDRKKGTIRESVTRKVIENQKGIHDNFLKIYLDYKEAEKTCSTYGQNYIDAINPITGRIHTTFWQLGANSGRMTCGSKSKNTDLATLKKLPADCCSYVQLQNLPADEITRSSFISEENNKFVSCDYSALESRLGADIYNEPAMIEEFLYGSGDMHSLCAKIVFNKELKDIAVKDIKEKRPDLRKKVKAIEFSQQFGGSAKAVVDALGCSLEEANVFVKAYAEGFKGISEFKKKGSDFVRRHGFIVICKKTGHWLLWEDWNKWRKIEDMDSNIRKYECSEEELKVHNMAAAKWDRLALNVVTQGTGIIILKTAMIAFFKWIVDNDLFNKVLICDLIHDEACVEFPKELENQVVPRLVQCMENSAKIYCTKLPIPAEPEVSTHWVH